MKQTSLFWILGLPLFSSIKIANATPNPVSNLPHYFNGQPTPPQQKTPKSIGYNCERMAEESAAGFAAEQLKMGYTEPFTRVVRKQLSWSLLNKKDDNLPVMREIYFFQFVRKNKSFSAISLVDSTRKKGECEVSSKIYRAFDDIDISKDDLLTTEKDDGSRPSVVSPHDPSNAL
ncbi:MULTISPECIES: hypothetical protein [unclassified Saccharibacter]|uniref:hypothetical protein n=1 Tax=unclassified Saccharibacter TaxID=2648722 RepID=UPI001329A67D|nr:MULTISPECIES: hypothetical protein [unclassified Saccharibacter]MXV36833.1 hypothetical protein [Saccharibacter sp. EH611]MXV58677.1 hypothetical protein [Saccharibacter sp. EH70]MXV66183.1 hypothetical protein [Saccharibacter sp. EH60]